MPPPRRRLTPTERGELAAKTIGYLLDALDLDAHHRIEVIAAALMCEMIDHRTPFVTLESQQESATLRATVDPLPNHVSPFNGPRSITRKTH